MKKILFSFFLASLSFTLFAGTVTKTYCFDKVIIKNHGIYKTISFANTILSGNVGEPMMPWHAVALMLPPGEEAASMNVQLSGYLEIEGTFDLLPQQNLSPVSKGFDGTFLKKEEVYRSSDPYPLVRKGKLSTSYMNGYAFALSTFTPLVYTPSERKAGYYSRITISVTTRNSSSSLKAMENLSSSPEIMKRLRIFADNPEMTSAYPQKKAALTAYKILIITNNTYQSNFTDLTNMYDSLGLPTQVHTVAEITSSTSGIDAQDKIRNFIKQEYQTNGVEYVLLGGIPGIVPYRGFYCHVISGSGYDDWNIPADLYYSGLDGTYDANHNGIYGELADSADLLPDIAVGRLPFNSAQELANNIHKIVRYRIHPIDGELAKPLMVGELLDLGTNTFGSDYLELLVGTHTDNGYYTHGIPAATNDIVRVYDSIISPVGPSIYQWDTPVLFADVNAGTSFIHHSGHANETYLMRLNSWDVTDATFHELNGIDHNYTFLYTHGCLCGAFDYDECIAAHMLGLQTFIAGGVFNSRYGWFDQGTTEGPSCHLHREFVSTLYNDTSSLQISEMGGAHLMSKILTAPWCDLPNEFEPGAQRWCHYCCNLLGDPALRLWLTNQDVGIRENSWKNNISVYPNPCNDQFSLRLSGTVPGFLTIRLFNSLGQNVMSWNNQTGNGAASLSFKIPGLVRGVYTLEVQGKDFSGRSKLVIK